MLARSTLLYAILNVAFEISRASAVPVGTESVPYVVSIFARMAVLRTLRVMAGYSCGVGSMALPASAASALCRLPSGCLM